MIDGMKLENEFILNGGASTNDIVNSDIECDQFGACKDKDIETDYDLSSETKGT